MYILYSKVYIFLYIFCFQLFSQILKILKIIENCNIIPNTNKIQEKICAEIQYKPVKNSCEIVGLIFPNFKWCLV